MKYKEELSNFFGDACFGACVSNAVTRLSQTVVEKEGMPSMLSDATLVGKYKPWKSMTSRLIYFWKEIYGLRMI